MGRKAPGAAGGVAGAAAAGVAPVAAEAAGVAGAGGVWACAAVTAHRLTHAAVNALSLKKGVEKLAIRYPQSKVVNLFKQF